MLTIRHMTKVAILAAAITAIGVPARALHYHYGYNNGQYGYHYHDHYDDYDDEDETTYYYGAIAYSRADGNWGYSYNYDGQNGANNAALQYCNNAGGRSCRIVLRVSNGCGALASGPNGWASETGNSRAQAERAAKDSCRTYTRGCVVKVWMCTTR